ncbi:zinc finger protein Gfi-1b-like [Armigeres subalbatus]|uniref:zinc finger protein Gfi-1b-like n=1 Tax=Armigeres subalbatus TaxID=124917 RepID=UPI002ED29A03
MEVQNSSITAVDWNEIYDVFVDCEKQHPKVEAEQRPLPSPVLEGDQAQLSFYDPQYDAEIVSHRNTFDGADLSVYSTKEMDLSVYSTLEELKEISLPDQYFQSSSVNDLQQQVYTSLDCPTGQIEPVPYTSSYPVQNHPTEYHQMGFHSMEHHHAGNFHGENYSAVNYPVEYHHISYSVEQQPVENFSDKDFKKDNHAEQIYSEVPYLAESGAEKIHTVDNSSVVNDPDDPLLLKQIENGNSHTIGNGQTQDTPDQYPLEYHSLQYHHTAQPEPVVAAQPQQQMVPQELAPDNTLFGFPIQLNIVGYLNPDGTLKSMMPSTPPKKSKNRNPKPRKKVERRNIIGDFPCKQCGRTFKSKGGLCQHNNSNHSGPMPHQCSVCGKRFRDIDIMLLHRQRHSQKDKPFKCTDCSKQFMFSTDLNRHVDLHHGVSRYVCSYCGKALDRRDHLKDHEMSHLNGTAKKHKASKLSSTVPPSA